MSDHPALAEGRAAVITGAAGGIGLAAAHKFASLGMKMCMADAKGRGARRRGSESSRRREAS